MLFSHRIINSTMLCLVRLMFVSHACPLPFLQSVKTVENAEKNGKVIEKWVRDISELHRSKPPPTVHYNK